MSNDNQDCRTPCARRCPCSGGGSVFLSGFHAQLNNAANRRIEDTHNVLFNLVTSRASSDITYNSATGEFTLCANKNYYVSWWIAVNGTDTAPIIEIAAVVDGVCVAIATSPQVTCQLSGTALISAKRVPQTLAIMNTTGDPIRYAATSIQANIVIMELALRHCTQIIL